MLCSATCSTAQRAPFARPQATAAAVSRVAAPWRRAAGVTASRDRGTGAPTTAARTPAVDEPERGREWGTGVEDAALVRGRVAVQREGPPRVGGPVGQRDGRV